jgi:4-hydroxy-3-methylbut-2-enyl diphosphate reductase
LLQSESNIVKDDTIIIRAHGISPQRRLYLENFGCEIIDCTCPLVQKIAKIIKKNKDRSIILLGDHGHEEVEGLCGYAQNIHVCGALHELAQLLDKVWQNATKEFNNEYKIPHWLMVCQSTLDIDFLGAAQKLCREKKFPIEIVDTICLATKQRQLGLKILDDCDAVIVIGGFHSANTKRLFEKIKQRMSDIFWIEGENDLENLELGIYKKIGLAAGTSTPRDVVQNIYDEILKNSLKLNENRK